MGTTPPIVVEAEGGALASVIALHGLGADGADLAPLAAECRTVLGPRVRWVFPTADMRPLAIAGGAPTTAWFDVAPDDLRRGEASDVGGLGAAEKRVQALIDREIERGVPSARIALGGFSQGGALACFVALRSAKPLAGVFALSTYLAGNVQIAGAPASRGLPAFAAHGTDDAIVPIARGRALRAKLEELGLAVTWSEYGMAHEICAEEVAALATWLKRVLR